MSKLKVLTPAEVEQFITDGYVLLRNVFSPETARACREFLYEKIGVSATDRSTWTKAVIHHQQDYGCAPFDAAFTPRLAAGYDDVMGEGRYRPGKSLGWWPVAFPGFEPPPWQVPVGGWHVDGIQFHHHLDSPDQGLLPIFIFSDIGPGDGGTAVDAGSHFRTARVLAASEPNGLSAGELTQKMNLEPPRRPIEMNGRAGDVVLLHPFMLHARSPNTGSSVRFICNPCISLHEKMNFQRANAEEYSPVELAVVRALKGTLSPSGDKVDLRNRPESA